MTGNFQWAVIIIVTALVESSWLVWFRVQGVMPDLILILVVFYAITAGHERAMMTGLLGGLLQDIAGNTGLGHHVLCLAVVGYAVAMVAERLVIDHPAVKALLVFAAGLAHGALFVAISDLQDPRFEAVQALAVSAIPRAFYTAIATPLIFFALDRARVRREPAQGGAA